MSLAPEQTDAALDELGEGASEPDAGGSLGGCPLSVPVGPADAVGLGSTTAEAGPSELGAELGARLAGALLVGALDGVPSPQPLSTSKPAVRIMERRTVPAVGGRMGVTRQA